MLQFSFLDSLLRRGVDLADELQKEGQARRFVREAMPWLFVMGAAYGFCMGAYNILQVENVEWRYSLISAVKVPILLMLTSVLCFPPLYVFGIAGGAKIRPGLLWACLTASLLVMCVLQVALMPVVLFFLSTIGKYSMVKFIHLIVWTISGFVALRFFARLVGKLDESLSKNGRLLFIWMLIFGLVGAQMGYMLRPFIGDPEEPWRIFRNFGGNILLDVFKMLKKLR